MSRLSTLGWARISFSLFEVFLVFSLLYFLSFLIKHILIHRFIFVLPFWSFLVFSLLYFTTFHHVLSYWSFLKVFFQDKGSLAPEHHEACVLFLVDKITDTDQFFHIQIMIFSYSDTTNKICKLYPDLAYNTVTKNTWSETIKWQKIARFLSLRANQIESSRVYLAQSISSHHVFVYLRRNYCQLHQH